MPTEERLAGPPRRIRRVWQRSESTLLRVAAVIGAVTVVAAAVVYLVNQASNALSTDPTKSVGEMVTERIFSDALHAPWIGKPWAQPGGRRFVEALIEDERRGFDPRLPGESNTKGEVTFRPEQAALEATLYSGETIGIANGRLMSIAAIRQTNVTLTKKNGERAAVTMLVAQIGEEKPGREGSVFCEFPRAVQRFAGPPRPKVGVLVEAEGVPIMVGSATGAGGGRGVAAYFVCDGVRRMRTIAEQ